MHIRTTIHETKYVRELFTQVFVWQKTTLVMAATFKKNSRQYEETCDSLPFCSLYLYEICKHVARGYDQFYESLHLYEWIEDTLGESA